MMKTRIQEAEINVEVNISESLPALHADERQIKQILINLLSNAIKFTPAAGRILVSARLNDDSCMEITVADTGIGIHAKDISKVLQPFGQVEESQKRSHHGTGLGLPICESLMRLHAGSLTIESEIGKGTSVTLAFPPERTVKS